MINPSLNKHNHRVLSFKSVQLSESSRENSPAWLSPGQELERYRHPTSPNHYILPPPQGYHYFDFYHHQILVLLFWTWYQWSHIAYIILYLACFTHITFVRSIHTIICSWVSSSGGQYITSLHEHIPQFMYPFCWCLFGFLPVWCLTNHALINSPVCVLRYTWALLGMDLLGLWADLCSVLVDNAQVFPECASLYSYLQYINSYFFTSWPALGVARPLNCSHSGVCV